MDTVPRIRAARWADKDHVAALIADALHPSPLATWLIPDPSPRRRILTDVLAIWIEHAMFYGDIYLTDDATAATTPRELPHPPQRRRRPPHRPLRPPRPTARQGTTHRTPLPPRVPGRTTHSQTLRTRHSLAQPPPQPTRPREPPVLDQHHHRRPEHAHPPRLHTTTDHQPARRPNPEHHAPKPTPSHPWPTKASPTTRQRTRAVPSSSLSMRSAGQPSTVRTTAPPPPIVSCQPAAAPADRGTRSRSPRLGSCGPPG